MSISSPHGHIVTDELPSVTKVLSRHGILAWHFLPSDCKTANQEGLLIKPGTIVELPNFRTLSNPWSTWTEDNPIALCHNGYHGSRSLADAITYCGGPILCRVLISGNIRKDIDKLAGRRRQCLAMLDIRPPLARLILNASGDEYRKILRLRSISEPNRTWLRALLKALHRISRKSSLSKADEKLLDRLNDSCIFLLSSSCLRNAIRLFITQATPATNRGILTTSQMLEFEKDVLKAMGITAYRRIPKIPQSKGIDKPL